MSRLLGLVVVLGLVAAALVVSPVSSAQAEAGVADVGVVGSRVVPVGRVAGDGRLETAVAIAGRSFPEGSGVVYVARADAFADALAAGTLTDGPILLVPSCGPVPAVVAAEVERLDPDVVVGLGGEAAVCGEMLSGVAGGREVDRIAGQDRFDTAIRVAQRGFGDGAGSVYVANGADSPDAVAGGALTDGPILLVPPGGGVLPTVADEVARIGPERVVALGGTGVVSDEQLGAAAGGIATGRLSGVNRFATSVAIAVEEFGDRPPVVYLARGDVFADAVASGSLTDGPIVLVPACGGLPAEVVSYLEGVATSQVIALGGQAAVCDEILNAAAALPTLDEDPSPPPPPGDPDPTPTSRGTLYSEWLSTIERLDLDEVGDYDPLEPDVLYAASGSVNVERREFTYTVGEWNEDAELHIRDVDTLQHVQAPMRWPGDQGDVTFYSEPLLANDGIHVMAEVNHDDLPAYESTLEVITRGGDLVYATDARALNDWVWEPGSTALLIAPTEVEGVAELQRLDPRSGSIELLATVPSDIELGGVSPAGDEVLLTIHGDLYTLDLGAPRSAPHQLTVGAYPHRGAVFSPDAGQVALVDRHRSSGTFLHNFGDIHVIDNHRSVPILIDSDSDGTLLTNDDGQPVIVRIVLAWSP